VEERVGRPLDPAVSDAARLCPGVLPLVLAGRVAGTLPEDLAGVELWADPRRQAQGRGVIHNLGEVNT
jgi:hypothetical protein